MYYYFVFLFIVPVVLDGREAVAHFRQRAQSAANFKGNPKSNGNNLLNKPASL